MQGSFKYYISSLFVLLAINLIAQTKTDSLFINPTGVYTFINKADTNNSGTINVKLLSKSRIAIGLFICMGRTAMNNGTLMDTLKYNGHSAVHHGKGVYFDSTCVIKFIFSRKGVSVYEKAADPNGECGFGHAVTAEGYYRKISSKPPKDKDLRW